jgi:hypothetical protein
MIPDEIVESEDKPASAETTSDRPRPSGRGRYPRGRRGPRRRPRLPDRATASQSGSEEPAETQAASDAAPGSKFEEHATAPPVPKGRAIYAAIEKVEGIITELKGVLNELELVMEYLEDVERQQITDEREIEVLRSRLESLHRRMDRAQPQRGHQGRQSQRHQEESVQNPA